jgi:hypothetical protein
MAKAITIMLLIYRLIVTNYLQFSEALFRRLPCLGFDCYIITTSNQVGQSYRFYLELMLKRVEEIFNIPQPLLQQAGA